MAIPASVHDYLDRERVRYEVIAHAATADAAHTAQAARVPGDRLAKSIVLEDDSGYLMAIIPASHRLDLPAISRELSRELVLANERELAELFEDCEPGAVPPLGQAYGIDVVVDRNLTDTPDIYFEAGDHLSLIHVSGQDFRRLMADSLHRNISHHL
ncbi:MAG: aminoacyl-tRNA deacylase [Steroidobacteraceae bacterium]